MPTKIQLKRTNELTDDKRKALVAAEPLVDLENNKVIIGKDGDNTGFALGDHAIAFTHTGEATTSPKLKLTTPNSSTELTIEGSNGIQVSDNSGALKIENTYDGHTQSSNTINKLIGYTKADNANSIATDDSLNTALGKLEYKADTHKHSVTHTPAGEIQATFTGATEQSTLSTSTASLEINGNTEEISSGLSSAVISEISASYTPKGSISVTDTLSGLTAVSTSTASGYLVSNAGTQASCEFPTLQKIGDGSLSAAINDNHVFVITASDNSYQLTGGKFTPNNVPTIIQAEVSSANHTHTVSVTHGEHTFTGTAATIQSTSTQSEHTHTIPSLQVSVSGALPDHSHKYTAEGTVAATFSGTSATLDTSSST